MCTRKVEDKINLWCLLSNLTVLAKSSSDIWMYLVIQSTYSLVPERLLWKTAAAVLKLNPLRY